MWLVNFVQGKNCLLEKTYWVTVGGRNLPSGSSKTTPTYIHPSEIKSKSSGQQQMDQVEHYSIIQPPQDVGSSISANNPPVIQISSSIANTLTPIFQPYRERQWVELACLSLLLLTLLRSLCEHSPLGPMTYSV